MLTAISMDNLLNFNPRERVFKEVIQLQFDLTEVLLGFYVLWDQLLPYFICLLLQVCRRFQSESPSGSQEKTLAESRLDSAVRSESQNHADYNIGDVVGP
jgi:hypothetical protein